MIIYIKIFTPIYSFKPYYKKHLEKCIHFLATRSGFTKWLLFTQRASIYLRSACGAASRRTMAFSRLPGFSGATVI